MAFERHCTSNSQSSSFNGSQESQHRPISGGSLTSSQDRPPRDITPSTSLSNPSSQEHLAVQMEQPHNYIVPRIPKAPTKLETRFSQAPVANMGSSPGGYTSAPKRTADGYIKQGNSTSPTIHAKSNANEHSRTSSTVSQGSQIGELSSALKTRLTYAMVKVQNGWETRNINELETHITSTQASPISTPSTLRQPYDLSRPGSSSTQPDRSSGGFMQLSERSTASATPERLSTAPHHHVGTAGLDYAYPQPSSATQSPPSANSGRTYESFWREHSHSNNTSRPITSSSAAKPTAPSLAPPVDITPRTAGRRTNASSSQQRAPRLNTNTANAHAAMPATPPPPQVRTPRQNTAEDIDAIETLVFMSSPKNSGYHPSPRRVNQSSSQSSSMPKTPLRQHIESFVERRTGFPPEQEEAEADHLSSPGGGAAPRLQSAAEIDRMLDEMSDASSSSGAEEGAMDSGTRRGRLRV